MKNILTIVVALFIVGHAMGQEAKLTFTSDDETRVEVYIPIDNSFNTYKAQYEIELKAGLSVDLKIPVKDFCFIVCEYSTKGRFNILLTPDTHLNLTYSNGDLTLSGDNAKANEFYNSHFVGNYLMSIDSIFAEFTKGEVELKNIISAVNHNMQSDLFDKIDSLKRNNIASDTIAQILTTNYTYLINKAIIGNLENLLYETGIKIDTLDIYRRMDAIYDNYPPKTPQILKYQYGSPYVNRYYVHRYYDMLNETEQAKLCGTYPKETFGPYAIYLLAPPYIQLPKFVNALLAQYVYMGDELDRDKMYDYLLSTLPANNQAIPIIDFFRRETAADEKNRSITFIDQPIENLSDLCKIPDLSGKYLFVDLWATWCLPCKMEFKHNKELHKMLSKYSNVESVYVSIDDAKSDKLWKSSIEQYPLNGYHLHAPPKSKLYQHIEKAIYNGGQVSIPQYVLIDPSGAIVERDLPRPSSSSELESILNKYLK